MISFKTPDEIFHVAAAVGAGEIQFSNYWVLFKDGDVIAIWNSLVVAGISSAMAMLLGTFCAYSLARFNTGGENPRDVDHLAAHDPAHRRRLSDLPDLCLFRHGGHLCRD